jgi:hypothetical protein
MGVAFVCVILLLVFVVIPATLFTWAAKRGQRKRFERIPHTVTEGELRTQKAMEGALRNAQQNQPPAGAPSLSARLTQLDEALHQGLITQQVYDKKRADIIASA